VCTDVSEEPAALMFTLNSSTVMMKGAGTIELQEYFNILLKL
jgi:hypothetical protein